MKINRNVRYGLIGSGIFFVVTLLIMFNQSANRSFARILDFLTWPVVPIYWLLFDSNDAYLEFYYIFVLVYTFIVGFLAGYYLNKLITIIRKKNI